MNNIKKQILSANMSFFLPLASCSRTPYADAVIYSDSVYTANEKGEFITSFDVKEVKYLALGNKDEMKPYINQNTKVIKTKFAMPGVIESHGHQILEQAIQLGCFVKSTDEKGYPRKFKQIIDDVKAYRNEHPNLGHERESSVIQLPSNSQE